ncbi:hypothetical protein DFH09DRAFT_1310589 [Mycena vulgaris]|nr:hypothetical protein DFH09DRAFT_1310589 [Mycena vulgaris]
MKDTDSSSYLRSVHPHSPPAPTNCTAVVGSATRTGTSEQPHGRKTPLRRELRAGERERMDPDLLAGDGARGRRALSEASQLLGGGGGGVMTADGGNTGSEPPRGVRVAERNTQSSQCLSSGRAFTLVALKVSTEDALMLWRRFLRRSHVDSEKTSPEIGHGHSPCGAHRRKPSDEGARRGVGYDEGTAGERGVLPIRPILAQVSRSPRGAPPPEMRTCARGIWGVQREGG